MVFEWLVRSLPARFVAHVTLARLQVRARHQNKGQRVSHEHNEVVRCADVTCVPCALADA